MKPSKVKTPRNGKRTKATGKRPDRITPARASKRTKSANERRDMIVAAGLAEFTAKGFAATRLEDVAKRAGVAKGTIYLYFKDKESLFQELVRTALVPVAARLSGFTLEGGSVRPLMEMFADTLVHQVVGTARGDIVRLIISEGTRFPSLAEFYYREVVALGIAGMRRLVEAGISRGEIHNKAFAEFPQLIVAPAVVAIVWQGLFGRLAPLDAAGMMRAHIDIIFSERSAA